MAEINSNSINALLKMNLNIPDYQRPYKWDIQNITDLFVDITNAIRDAEKYRTEFRYRIGTIILHKTKGGTYDIVDGQQRIISLVLIKLCMEPDFKCSILEREFSNKITQYNIHRNYQFINEWFSANSTAKASFGQAFEKMLEVVVVCVENVAEAFQLFDSQNTRGKELDPHDLLKAYHLREMKEHPYEMQHAVTKWEMKDTAKIKELFDMYLFPVWNWSRGIKCKAFTAKEIDIYKGIAETSTYTYARRARRTMPYFQLTSPFISGNDFFEMVEHYMTLLRDIKSEICNNDQFKAIKLILCNNEDVGSPEEMDKVKFGSAGLSYTRYLFYCAVLSYYDKFHNFDEMAIKKLFVWAFMLRVDMVNLGYDSVNKYAIGADNSRYTNTIGMFAKINLARMHHEISSLQIKVQWNPNDRTKKWQELYKAIEQINGCRGA